MRKVLSIIVIIALVISVSLNLIYYSQGYLKYISVWPIDPLWARVFVTVVLVGINAYYAWQIRQTIAEMEKARKAEFMPHVKAALTFLGPVLVFQNVPDSLW